MHVVHHKTLEDFEEEHKQVADMVLEGRTLVVEEALEDRILVVKEALDDHIVAGEEALVVHKEERDNRSLFQNLMVHYTCSYNKREIYYFE